MGDDVRALNQYFAITCALIAFSSPSLAQDAQGTSPLTGAKGGTNNAFMQFAGPASSLKTFTLPNANDTLATLAAIQTFTAAKTFASAKLLLAGSTSGAGTLNAPAVASSYVWTLPAATDTLAGISATQALTNKTYNGNIWTGGSGTLTLGAGKTATISNTLTFAGTDGSAVTLGSGGTVAYLANTLNAFASTTSGQLASVISDETGSGALVFGTSPSLVTPNLGTPSALTLTNATGLPIAGISGLGSGIGTWFATPSSANLAAAVTNETGSGLLVFGTSPNITTPTGIVKGDVGLGNVDNTSDTTKWAATKTLTNTTFNCGSTGNVCTVRLASDITGFGTGVATALGINIGSAGAAVLFNGAGGTPSSMVGTNITGTAAGLTAGNVTTNANLTGEVTSVGNATTVANASVIAKVLTAFSASAGTVSSSDSILAAFQKVVGNLALKAELASPALTGTPTAPTAGPSNNSTQLATTAYVDAQVAGGVAGVGSFNGLTGAVTTNIVVQKFTASGTYTPTSGMRHAVIECLGGGGGGAGTTNSTASTVSQGASGSGGGRSIKYTTAAAVGASQTVTIGAAGAAGAASTAGGNGGDTSVGSLCIGKGGIGGPNDSARASAAVAVAGTGDITGTGQVGSVGTYQLTGAPNAHNGANTIYGSGGIGVFNNAGGAATGFGASGAGGHSFNGLGAQAGGAGAAGIVIITEYVNL